MEPVTTPPPTNPNPAGSSSTATPVPTPPTAAAPPGPAAPANELPSIPQTWPGAFGVYKYSKRAVKINTAAVISLLFGSIIIDLLLELGLKQIGEVLSFIVGSLLTVSLTFAYIAGVRGQHMSPSQALRKGLPLWLKMIGLTILVYVSYAISILLLILPFFWVYPRLALATYFLVDKDMGIIDAYKASWNSTKGHGIQIWGVTMVSVLFAILVLIIVGIPLFILYSAAFAVMYEFLNRAQPVVPTQSVATPQPSQPPAT